MSEDVWDRMNDLQEQLEQERTTYLIQQCEARIWVTSGGKHIPFADLKYGHLGNCVAFVDRMGPEGDRWMYRDALRRELRRRSLAATPADP